MVVASTPCMLNSSVQVASTAAITTGRYPGRQPAMTALTATFSTVHSTRFGGTIATTSPGRRCVPSSMRRTRASVGGTTGSPSDHPRSHIASHASSAAGTSTRRLDRGGVEPVGVAAAEPVTGRFCHVPPASGGGTPRRDGYSVAPSVVHEHCMP